MRISDWSSDVCSSDLFTHAFPQHGRSACARSGQEQPGAETGGDGRRDGEGQGAPVLSGAPRLREASDPGAVQAMAGNQLDGERNAAGRDQQDGARRGAEPDDPAPPGAAGEQDGGRSEEHTSDLQSLMRISYAVFCLKKKQTHTNHT